MTFSVAGVCPDTGMVGCAITSSSICVTSRCAFTRANTGVALTQNITNPDLGPLALDLMQQGQSSAQIMQALASADSDVQWRQLGILALDGQSSTFSGAQALGIHATASGKNCIAMGNLLANEQVPQAMIDSFENSRGHLAERLISALHAGKKAGGELGPIHSAGINVNAQADWPVVDLRVDWHEQPIDQLTQLWALYEPQMQAYITRATDPANAESYGVPGDE